MSLYQIEDDLNREEPLSHSLSELLNTESFKWIFIGGKGGVGKTTTACSIAVEFTKHRESVLIISTDPAHNLSDSFGQKFSGTPSRVEGFENLDAMEIETNNTDSGGFHHDQGSGIMKLIPELTQSFPGIDEIISLATLMQSVRTMNYSIIIFDTAPTGHTLRLLAFPDLLEKGLLKFSSLSDKFSSAFNLISSVSGRSSSEPDVNTILSNLNALVNSIRQTLKDPTKTTFVCVCIPEFLSIYETERLINELTNQEIECSNIVVNQVQFPLKFYESINENFDNQLSTSSLTDINTEIPSNLSIEEENIYLKEIVQNLKKKLKIVSDIYISRRVMQSKYLKMIKEIYESEFHIVSMPQLPNEVRGKELLKKFGNLLMQNKSIPNLDDLQLTVTK